ncbi:MULTISPECIES: class I SAM-dependent methyltransferase [unclassified Anabaena]|uniref:class I SAM-dependent methyltransferase n=1 Tax=unclassified Anabaena TaxID=2619674 RepID=UPI001445F7F0|nr:MULTISPECIES: class I SAM-dependent methyltransferase [unclassified Anabaena]MTJ09242.1 class I SAM-dependent methyltransferase [Anabaena sp. UHCC 0204]MTJ52348.1 class I SAM-dependent methyltransferase [Anabaena sp. UHCC 0253]
MKELKLLQNLYSQDLETRKNWYSHVAEAYNRLRPGYSPEIIDGAVKIAQLPPKATILELGCGPGNATLAFAKLGFSMKCLEPSLAACNLAKQNCKMYPLVEIQPTTFEEWELEPEKFDAVLAATSFHWINPEFGNFKISQALRNNGCLILLWNMTPQPEYEVYLSFQEVYQKYAPFLDRYEDIQTQKDIVQSLGQKAIDSGKFQDLVSQQIVCKVNYSVDDFLLLLSTYTPYLKLEIKTRNNLFAGLREKIENNYGGNIQITYVSAFQVARKYEA